MKRNILLGSLGLFVAACGSTDSTAPAVNPLFIGGPPPPPPAPTTYSGRGTVLSAKVLFATTTLGDTGPLPSSGGSLHRTLLSVSVPGVLSAGAADAATEGGNGSAASSATVADVSVGLAGVGVSASVLTSETSASCASGSPVVAGSSEIADLVINGQAITVTGAPNQTIYVPGGRVVINEQVQDPNSITVSALRVILLGGLTDVVVSKSHSDIHCGS